MYIVLIGYLYVIVMLAAGTGDPAKGIALVVMLGLLPTWLWFWLRRQGQIKRAQKRAEQQQAQIGADER
ncbi:hypothetical protein N8I74_08975 [Chitiniphilus purpureus]|uniref:Uncharacterized protein n=1 Tax=Chitiniphilus purpureus TaxID=2981137 RepID=A0ABY6DRX3_9NEIS|nr:hypothetical protein [Chitiniphilus sp. CD1]UXY17125.1 hypothetical protein N8I74_08975 [Chitiniphilus sp. CD1]